MYRLSASHSGARNPPRGGTKRFFVVYRTRVPGHDVYRRGDRLRARRSQDSQLPPPIGEGRLPMTLLHTHTHTHTYIISPPSSVNPACARRELDGGENSHSWQARPRDRSLIRDTRPRPCVAFERPGAGATEERCEWGVAASRGTRGAAARKDMII